MIVTLRPFAHGWPGALFFTIENKGRKREGFKNDRDSEPCFLQGTKVLKREGFKNNRHSFARGRPRALILQYTMKVEKRGPQKLSPLCGHFLMDGLKPCCFFLVERAGKKRVVWRGWGD